MDLKKTSTAYARMARSTVPKILSVWWTRLKQRMKK